VGYFSIDWRVIKRYSISSYERVCWNKILICNSSVEKKEEEEQIIKIIKKNH